VSGFVELRPETAEKIALECLEYARQYRCTLNDALADWEGEGPGGSWGLNANEKAQVARVLSGLGHDLDTVKPE